MGSEETMTLYEEMQKRNVERNLSVMRMLGLCPPRCDVQLAPKAARSVSTATISKKEYSECRRSARIASLKKSSSQLGEFSEVDSSLGAEIRICRKSQAKKLQFSRKVESGPTSNVQKVLPMMKKMEYVDNLEEAYITDSSTESLYAVQVEMDAGCSKSFHENIVASQIALEEFKTTSSAVNMDFANTNIATAFGAQFQELVIRALMQSTASLIGPSLGVTSVAQDVSTASPVMTVEGVHSTKTWNESTYNQAEARRKRKTQMTRTLAREGSDSPEDFPVPQDESPQQRSVRTRRLNRSRSRRAQDLTSNRKAFKKLPYIIYVDGTAKAKGIHKHLWRAVVRGQCGRLDPTMDNINHHPKHVVDSIWHALEKEWEFEGFAHRAREMFERSTTKFMRNRKMQLKYKCQKNFDSPKPDDISGAHWMKIVDLTKKSTKQITCTGSRQSTTKGIDEGPPLEKENSESVLAQMEDDVEARIQYLQTELLKLQNSKKNEDGRGGPKIMGKSDIASAVDTVFEDIKENVMPSNKNRHQTPQVTSGTTRTERNADVKGKLLYPVEEKNSFVLGHREQEIEGHESGVDINETEMDCGDVVRVFAFTGGRKEEIGKGIVMGLSGSKFARKVIPKGWRSIKITSYTSIGASKVCPLIEESNHHGSEGSNCCMARYASAQPSARVA